jgi:hypothetical protein
MHTFGNFIQIELFANVVDHSKHYHQRWRHDERKNTKGQTTIYKTQH